jgi:hypothetical protein
LVSLWLDEEQRPVVPAAAVRACVESGARRVRQGPLVREGLRVESVERFGYDEARYGCSLDELGVSAQFTAAVVVQRARILRTRAKFDAPWSLGFTVEVNPELVGEQELAGWLEIAGDRVGLGDWRPEKSGGYGRFRLDRVEAVSP